MDCNTQDDRYKVVDDIIYYKNQIFLVSESKLKQKILKEVHDSPLVGDLGFPKTYKHLRERFSGKGLKGDVLQYVRECAVCQQNKFEILYQPSYCNLCQFQNRSGKVYQWIS